MIRNPDDLAEVASWLLETDLAFLNLVRWFEFIIEPTSFADLLDIGTSNKLTEMARTVILAMKLVGVPSTGVKVITPKMKHLSRDPLLMLYDLDNAEKIRRKFVMAFEEELKGKEEGLVHAFEGLMKHEADNLEANEEANGGC